MKHLFSYAIAIALCVLLLNPSVGLAQQPRTLSYQGILTDSQQEPIANGTYTLTFSLYPTANGGTPLWTETNQVQTQIGVFDAILGQFTPITLPFDQQYWLGITLQGKPEMTPRIALVSAPYAMNALQSSISSGLTPNATGAVLSLNNLAGNLTIQGTGATSITQAGNTLTVSSEQGVKSIAAEDNSIVVNSSNGAATTLRAGIIPLKNIAGTDATANDILRFDGTNWKPAKETTYSGSNAINVQGQIISLASQNASAGQVLKWNGTAWMPANDDNVSYTAGAGIALTGNQFSALTTGGDLSGAHTNATVTGLIGKKILATSLLNGQVLAYNQSTNTWQPTFVDTNPNDDMLIGTAAGGDLAGTYPNPAVANGAITNLKLGAGSVTTEKIADGQVTLAKLAPGIIPTSLPPTGAAGGDLSGSYPNPTVANIQGKAVSNTAPTNGQVLSWNGITNKWEPSAAGSGSVTSVGLTLPSLFSVSGSPITTSGTLSASLATQNQNLMFASPDGATGAPTFRAITSNDLPTIAISKGGTGATTANAGLNNLLPTQTGNSGKVLQTDGTNSSWVTGANGSVTSVGLSLPSLFSVSGSPITTAGTLSASLATQNQNLMFASPDGSTGAPTFRAITANDLPTIAISKGGTGATTANAGLNNLLPTQTGNSGKVLQTDGTNTTWANAATGSVTSVGLSLPSLFSVSGSPVTTAGTLSATLATQTQNLLFASPDGATGAPTFRAITANDLPTIAISKGGTGATTANAGLNNLLPTQTGNSGKVLQTDGTNTTWANAATGSVTSVGLSLPSLFSVSGSPVTTAGTLSATLATQTQNLLFASPDGSTGAPTFRAITVNDLPTIAITKGGTGATTANAGLNNLLPTQTGNSGKVLQTDGTNTTWANAATGSVTSVGLSLPSLFSVSGSPVTTAGTLSATLATQTQNLLFASPDGATGAPTFRAITANDLPTIAITKGGTGATTANAGLNNLLPTQTGNSGKVLQTDGTNTTWANAATGSVTSVGLSLPSLFSVSGSPITTSGTLSASLATQNQNLMFASPDGATGAPTFRAITANDLPTIAISKGGTGATTANAGLNNLLPTQTGNSGKVLQTDGTNTTWANAATGSVTSVGLSLPSLFSVSGSPITTAGTLSATLATQNQNLMFASPDGATGAPTFRAITANDLPTIAIAKGGTGATTANTGLNNLLPTQTGNSGKVLQTDGTNTTWANAATGSVTSVGLSLPSLFSVSGSPVTTAGTLSASLATQNQNLIFASPDGSTGAPTFRAITANDLPTIAISKGGTGATTANTGLNNLLPTQTGNSGKVLQTDGTNTSWTNAYGGLVNWTEALSSAAPNATVPVVQFAATNAAANVDAAITPKGTGALTAQVANSAVSGGNKRGANAVDWQTIRSAATQVASGNYATVSGGFQNTASSTYSTTGGGGNNTAGNTYATVSGGDNNLASGAHATIGGGQDNTASAAHTFVGGGNGNAASAAYATVSGGTSNTAANTYSTVGGGGSNSANNTFSSVGGGYNNAASGDYSAINGGESNTAGDQYATVSGGQSNVASGLYASIGGGASNGATGIFSTIGGGDVNLATGINSTVSGGAGNTASAANATVSGGNFNTASGYSSLVSGGYLNSAGGDHSTILGGNDLTFTVNAARSVGFNGNNSAGTNSMTINVPNVAVFSNTNFWLANNNSAASELRFYESQSSTGAFPAATTNYTAFKAGTQAADITYTLPTTAPANGQVLSSTSSGIMSWVNGTSGSVTSVGLSLPSIFSVSGSPVTTAGTLSATLASQTQNLIFASPDGSAGAPTFRAITANDLPTIAISKGGTGATTANAGLNNLLPTQTGNSGKVLQTDGTNSSWVNAYGGLVNWTESVNSTAPNATTPVVQFLATNAATNVDAAITPKGTGAFIVQIPTNTAAGGDKRGTNAVDMQMSRTATTQVASGNYAAVGGGQNNTASGLNSAIGGGTSNTASGQNSTVNGGSINTANSTGATIGGGNSNQASNSNSTVGGGNGNVASGQNAAIGGGDINTASGLNSTVGGGSTNSASVNGATISGGLNNIANGGAAAVGGGSGNTASGSYSTVTGGRSNTASGNGAFVGGGGDNGAATSGNTASGAASSILGGYANSNAGDYSSILGGRGLTLGANADRTIGYHANNAAGSSPMTIDSADAAVFGNTNLWLANTKNAASELRFYEAQSSTGAFPAAATNYSSFKAGTQSADITYILPTAQGSANTFLKNDGSGNLSWGSSGLINFTESINTTAPNNGTPVAQLIPNHAAGNVDFAIAPKGQGALLMQIPDNTVAGGNKRGGYSIDFQTVRTTAAQVASGIQSFLGGGGANTVSGSSSGLVSGANNTVSGNYAFLGGGYLNNVSAGNGVIGGGERSTLTGSYDFIGGGYQHTAGGVYSTIGGGYINTVSGNSATVSGGNGNNASASNSAVGGGIGNSAQATGSVIPGGTRLGILQSAGGTFGFNGDTTGYGMNLSLPQLSVFGNTNLAVGGTDGVAHEFRFYEGQSGSSYFPGGGINYTAFKAGTMSADITYTLPTTQGGANTFMKNDGSGNLSWGTTGLVNFIESVNSSTPNAGIPVVQLTPNNAGGSVDISLAPKGAGSLLAQIPDNTATGGNKRGSSSVDLQIIRAAATQVVSGNQSFLGSGSNNTVSGSTSAIVGGASNTVSGNFSFIGGGVLNVVSATDAAVAGGDKHTVSGQYSFVGGGYQNTVSGTYGTIAGGNTNTISGNYATISGGSNNGATGGFSSVSGGSQNLAQATGSTVAGGIRLQISSSAGGSFGFNGDTTGYGINLTLPQLSVFANTNLALGGTDAVAHEFRFYEGQSGSSSFPAGGINYTAFKAGTMSADITYTLPTTQGGANTFMKNDGSGTLSWATPSSLANFTESVNSSAPNATVPVVQLLATNAATNVDVALTPKGTGALTGQIANSAASGGNKRGANAVDWQTGRSNASEVASGTNATIGGGYQNTSSNTYSTVSGGIGNIASGNAAFVGGGNNNTASNTYSTIGGGNVNIASALLATVGGGYSNTASSSYTTISGGYGNTAISTYASVGGGSFNATQNSYATIAGGRQNTASGPGSFIGGGGNNGTVDGGNTAAGLTSVVDGGLSNSNSGDYSTILGGRGLTFSSSAPRAVGFHANNSAGSLPMTIDASDVAVFGNTNIWLANNKNTASELRFYEAQNSSGTFPVAATNYTAFKAGTQSADITYTLPTAQGGANSVLTNDGSGGLTWGKKTLQLLNQAVDCANLPAAGGTAYVDIAVTGAVVGSTVHVSPRGDMEDGVVIASVRVSAADNVRIKFVNATAGAINPAAVNFDITVIQP